MVESVFQTLMLLAYFNIALLSVTIANYAVSASYLGRESRLSRWRMERRKRKLVDKLKELRETAQIESIKKEIKESETEHRGLSIRIFLLSWLGAVILPSMFFGASLVCALLGLNSEILSENPETQRFFEQQFMIFSTGTLVTGFMVLLFVIRTIDSAARKLPIPEFKVSFPDGLETMKFKRGKKELVTFDFKNKGEDIAEDVAIFVHFPPGFNIEKSPTYNVTLQDSMQEYPGYYAVCKDISRINIDVGYGVQVAVIMPQKKGNYEIFITVHERKIGVLKYKLIIEIVD